MNANDAALKCDSPLFILTASRSGSTLLRFILDSHPQLACPPETMITEACVCMLRSWDILENAGSSGRLVTEPVTVPEEAASVVRNAVDLAYSRYLARRGKQRWCDKSLDSFRHAPLLAELYPKAKFICLYRHCMDVVASGIEACPWGLSRYGFDAYVVQNPGNNIAAIASYWLDNVRAIMAFEQRNPDCCHRVRYEDLVTEPEETAAALFAFAGIEPAPGITADCFRVPHDGDGPGDEKIWFTSGITSDAIGRGVAVPADALMPELREQINESLDRLGYRIIDQSWNSALGPVDPRDGSRSEEGSGAGTPPELQDAIVAIRSRIESLPDDELVSVSASFPVVAGQTVAFVASAGGQQAKLEWAFPGARPLPIEGAVLTLTAEPGIWLAILEGRTNLVTEVKTARLRCVNKRDVYRVRSDEFHAVAKVLGLARIPLTRLDGASVSHDSIRAAHLAGAQHAPGGG